MSQVNDQQQQRDILDVNSHSDHLSPLSNRFLVAHSSPVHESTNELLLPPLPTRHPDDSFQSSSSNSKSSSSTHSHASRLQYRMIQHQSAVNSPLVYSRCTSLGSLSSFDIRSSCNESYTSECSSIKPSGLISPSDMPDSPPCEPEILEDDQQIKPINRTLTMNTTSSLGRTTMMGETVIEKTFVLHQQDIIRTTNHIDENQEIDDDEHLDEVIVYTYDTSEMNKISYNNEILFDDDSYRIFNSQIDEDNSQSQTSFNVPSHENLSVITEESSFIEIEEMNSNDENNSIKILYDLIKKPHWTTKAHRLNDEKISNTSFSSDPSSLSLNSLHGNSSGGDDDDEDEYDQEKGQQLIQRLIEETLARRSLRTDYLRSTSCTHCPSNTPLTTDTRSTTSSSSSSSSVSTKSCSCTNKSLSNSNQPQRSQSSPARPMSTVSEDTKRQVNRQKENLIHHTRTSYLRLRQAQQNRRLNNQDKRI